MESPPGSNTRPTAVPGPGAAAPAPQLAVLDFFFPGFSGVSGVVFKHLGVDLNLYVPLLVLVASLTFAWDYIRDYFWGLVSKYYMSTVEIRIDDEIYDMIMTWVATQNFAQSSRHFVANTTLSSKTRHAWRYWDVDSDSDDDDEVSERKDKALSYTPSFGTHNFWYKGRLLQFRRTLSKEQANYNVTESEEVSISCYGRNPWVLKELLLDARAQYLKKDNDNTLIYRGTCVGLRAEPTWRRCLARASRPLSTVILSEAKKKTLVEDLSDYLAPSTRRWYSNRGIPYRRGYLLYGPPGTGKSSLSLALAGHFGMRIYIVGLNSISSNEENLSNLFAELPRRCVVLLEDIDTAGLTNTRETCTPPANLTGNGEANKTNQLDKPANSDTFGRLSLSGLLNILDGVASQEGRVLIMTTNHMDKLDSALIRPGRVDMAIEFGRADGDIAASIFTAIYTKLEGEEADEEVDEGGTESGVERLEAKRGTEKDDIETLALQFAAKIPADEFSPAEVQGYLLRHKRSARDAVRNVDSWVAELRKQKKKGSASSEQGTIAERKEEPKAEQKRLGQERAGEIDKDAEGRASLADQIRLDGSSAEASPSALEAESGPPANGSGFGTDTS